jgi:aspartyl protease family protein
MRAGVFIALLLGGGFVASMANELSGSQASAPGLDPRSSGVAWLAKGDDGHYYAEALVAAQGESPTRVRFIVDTGASAIALTASDAARLGLDAEDLRFNAPVTTANGETTAARVRLARVSVSGVELRDVDAYVFERGLSQSLLGMSYLGRLSKMEANGDALILRR